MKIDNSAPAAAAPRYQRGFGNVFCSEAIPGALPEGQNSPQRCAFGLYAEGISGTAFTAPRAENRHAWLYRILPSVAHEPFAPLGHAGLATAPRPADLTPPNRYRWDPLPAPQAPTDFIDGLFTYATLGDAGAQRGLAVHLYALNRSMERRYFVNADGELLILPQEGELLLFTELGRLTVGPGELAVIPRGVRFRVDLHGASAAGYVCENYGQMFRLPELGLLGANGLANRRDFLVPEAAYEDLAGDFQLVQKFMGRLWHTRLDHSPLDVVAWHGNYVPYKYALKNFMVYNTVSFDHADPSIFTVLTSPSDVPGVANADFVIFPPRWSVAEHTFRPPYFHRNVMSEFMGLLQGRYEVRAAGFRPGGAHLHNCLAAHGADPAQFEASSVEEQKPVYMDGFTAFMIESRYPFQLTPQALDAPHRQPDYDAVWRGFTRHFRAPA